MNKLLQKVAKIFLGLSMAAGVGVAIGSGRKDASPVHGEAQTSSDSVTASSGSLSGFTGSKGSAYSDGSVKFQTGNGGHYLENQSLFSGDVSAYMTKLEVTFNYKWNSGSSGTASNNALSVTPYINNSGYGSATSLAGFSSSSYTNKTITVNSGLTNCVGFKIAYAVKGNGNIAIKKLSWTATYEVPSGPTYYTVTYKSGDGSGTDVSIGNIESGTTYTLLSYTHQDLNYTAPDHCSFGGWSVVIGSASAVTKNASETISVTANTVCTAIWTDTRTALTLSATAASSNVNVGSTLSLTISATAGGNPVSNLSYTCGSSSNSIATVTNAGVITGVSDGNATITINFEGNATYKPASTTFSVTVKTPFPESGSFTITASDFSGSQYSTNDGEHQSTVGTTKATWVSSNVASQSGIQFRKSPVGYIYNTTDLGNIISVEIESEDTFTVTYGTSENSGCTSSSVGTGNGFFKIAGSSSATNHATSIVVTWGSGLEKLATPSPNYNNSLKQVAWNAVEHASSYEVKVDSGNYTTATSPYSVSGLTEDVQHTVYVKAIGDGETYDDSDAGSVQFTPTTPKVVDTVTLSTSDSQTSYDAGGNESIAVTFNTSITYDGPSGTGALSLSVSPTNGAEIGTLSNGSFAVTFSKNDTFTVRSESVEDNTKYAEVEVTISNIVKTGYEKINSISDISSKGEYLIYIEGSTSNAVAAGFNNSNYYNVGVHTATNDYISSATATSLSATEFKFEVTTGGYLIKDTVKNMYLAVTSDSNNIYHLTENDEYNSALWTLNFDSDGSVFIKSGRYTNRDIEYNISSTRFATYKSSYVEKVYLYKEIDNSPYFTLSEVNTYLGVKGQKSISAVAHNNASATVTWSLSAGGNEFVQLTSDGLTANLVGKAHGDVTLTATFTPNTFETLQCTVHVIEVDDYVTIGITAFTKKDSINSGNNETWDGTYLLVDTTNSRALSGSTTNIGNSVDVTVVSSTTIAATNTTIGESFNISKVNPSDSSNKLYTIKSSSNLYIGNHISNKNGIESSYSNDYVVSISDSGVITAVLEDGSTLGETTLQAFKSGAEYGMKFYKGSNIAMSLFKADGERRAISDTIADWYDDAIENEYLVCNEDTTKSKLDWDSLYDSAILMLESDDYDTLKTMTARSAEDNGNYLEDFISDYDYLVKYKHYNDFLDRFKQGGAMYGQLNPHINLLSILGENTNTVAIIVIISMVSVTAIGGYFFLRKRKENI